ncbi:MAG: homoserine O-acetyltransferase [Ignavibacteriae bacterium]|nr:homoserine O-acetyltransferase [Ignavibacteriota bacterium]
MIANTKFENFFSQLNPLHLDCGEKLNSVNVAYQSYGELNSEKNNVIIVNHALTGNSHAAGIVDDLEIKNSESHERLNSYNKMFLSKEGWWSQLIGKGKALDTDKYFVICPNILGSCYGTTGPTSLNQNTNQSYGMNFPQITVRDMIKVQKELLDKLGISKIELIVGGSLGGMQVLEWAIMYPKLINKIMPIATSSAHSAWAIGLNEASRNAIINDPDWENGNYKIQPEKGISLARKIAMISYRSYNSFNKKFDRTYNEKENIFEIESYLNYQGEKLTKRFDANTYLYLSNAMDLHDVGKGRGGIDKALSSIISKTMCVGIDSDILYPVEEQKEIQYKIPNAKYSEIYSIHGHDAFLIEFDQLDRIIRNFLNE